MLIFSFCQSQECGNHVGLWTLDCLLWVAWHFLSIKGLGQRLILQLHCKPLQIRAGTLLHCSCEVWYDGLHLLTSTAVAMVKKPVCSVNRNVVNSECFVVVWKTEWNATWIWLWCISEAGAPKAQINKFYPQRREWTHPKKSVYGGLVKNIWFKVLNVLSGFYKVLYLPSTCCNSACNRTLRLVMDVFY